MKTKIEKCKTQIKPKIYSFYPVLTKIRKFQILYFWGKLHVQLKQVFMEDICAEGHCANLWRDTVIVNT